METVLVTSRIAAPVASVWPALAGMWSNDVPLPTASIEVLGGQPPTLLSFRLLSGAPVRRNVVAVQLRPDASGWTEVCIDSAFQPAPAGLGGRARRRMRRVLRELANRLEDAVATADHADTGGTTPPATLGQADDSGWKDRLPSVDEHGDGRVLVLAATEEKKAAR